MKPAPPITSTPPIPVPPSSTSAGSGRPVGSSVSGDPDVVELLTVANLGVGTDDRATDVGVPADRAGDDRRIDDGARADVGAGEQHRAGDGGTFGDLRAAVDDAA